MQDNFSRILRTVAEGEEVQITRRKDVVARIVPDSGERADTYPDFVARAEELFGGSPGTPVSELLNRDRGERL